MLSIGGSTISQREETIFADTMPLEFVLARPLTGVTNPARASVPNTSIDNGNVFTSSLSWNITPALFIEVNPATFDHSSVYTATITLTANNGFSFSPSYNDLVSISGWTVNGLSPSRFIGNTNDQLMFEVTFPQTSSCPLNTFGSWGTTGTTHHRRDCNLCSFQQTDPHIWPTTGGSLNNGWQQGDAANHTRVCMVAGCTEVNHANHNMSTLGVWQQGTTTQHTRTRHCNVCDRQMTNENVNHTWVNFTGGNSAANHRCPTCLREAAHAWPAYGNWLNNHPSNAVNQHYRVRTCSTVGCNQQQNESGNHTWNVWSNLNTTHHRRTCSLCARNEDAGHVWQLHQSNVMQETVCRIHRCPTCAALLNENHHTSVAVQYRTFFRTTLNCVLRARACSLCGFNPRYIHDANGFPRIEQPGDSGVHRWTAWSSPTGFATRRCSNCGLQQWRNSNVHICGQTTKWMRSRRTNPDGSFGFDCSVYCSFCTAIIAGTTTCINTNPNCTTHNSTAYIEFRLNMPRPPNYRP
jgi:hypothetical protein